MKAMILAAGMGSRLADITRTTPKCLVEVAGVPIIKRVILSLMEAGVRDFVVNLHYRAEDVRDYLESLRDPSISIEFSYEDTLLDTGGGLRYAQHYFDQADHVFIHNADIYSELPLKSMLEAHLRAGATVTLYTRKTEDPRVLLFSQQGNLVGWRNRSTNEQECISSAMDSLELGFCGISIVSKRFFDFLQDYDQKFSLISPFLKASSQGEKVLSYEDNDSFWIDMGTPEKLETLRNRLGGKQ